MVQLRLKGTWSISSPSQQEKMSSERLPATSISEKPCMLIQGPLEIFDIIVSQLNRKDRLALMRTSRTVYVRIGRSFYSTVKLKGEETLKSFISLMTVKPHIRHHIRTFWIERNNGEFISNVPVEQLSSLHTLCFRPAPALQRKECRYMAMMLLDKLTTGQVSQSLRYVYFEVQSGHSRMLSGRQTFDHILQDLLSVPQLEYVQAFLRKPAYTYQGGYSDARVLIEPRKPPKVRQTRFTNLKGLVLHWDALPLLSLSILLRIPRNLESLTLIFSLNYDHGTGAPPLDRMLEPVTNSLKMLDMSTPYNDPHKPVSAGLRFSNMGLTAFQQLRELYIPDTFLSPENGFDGISPWFPLSLESIGFSNSWPLVFYKSIDIDPGSTTINRDVVSVPLEQRQLFDHVTLRSFDLISGMLDSLPLLSSVHIPRKPGLSSRAK
ncbi:hypothetical protein BJY04DRAFT_137170 [Aspergillus karnatakaensis]|uniref:uncharacterized protein n=1 Tax=Aspergillus karnatakaensis TaxID=1810916 RepID=UPI003CCCC4F2